PKYALAWNNLGVVEAHTRDTDGAIEALRTALQLQGTFSAARLNLALLLYQLRRFQLSLEAYRQVLATEPRSAPAWNGVGLVLVELKRFPDARNAFARAVEADPEHAGAHYNLSFTLSNLGDFDGALRATKRALELDPYYVSQKFQLTIDLQYERATIGIAPEISADVTAETIGEDFAFDQRLLDNIFQELAPVAPPRAVAQPAADDPLALARDYVSKGLMDVAAAEAVRAVQRGAQGRRQARGARRLPGGAGAGSWLRPGLARPGAAARGKGRLERGTAELRARARRPAHLPRGRAGAGGPAAALRPPAPGGQPSRRDAGAGPVRLTGAAVPRARAARRQTGRARARCVLARAQVRPRPPRGLVPCGDGAR